jgi:hypothetical protein
MLSAPVYGRHNISGFVKDRLTGEALIGANIFEPGTTNGTSTDNNGYFSLTIFGDSIQASFIGYKSKSIDVFSDTLVTITLESGEMLGEVTVRGEQAKSFNVSTLNRKEMLNIPSIGGKPDVLKSLQLLPGIQSQQEGSSLLNVRGGNPGENLYLIDNIPLIYVNHLGGLFSVFNPDMINNIELYKGGFPAKYGGKLSSIVAITQREGDKSGLKGSLGIGITDVSFTLEGPLLKKKASFIVTGRKTLTEPLFLLTTKLIDSEYDAIYGFHDFNAKFSWHPDEKNSLYINVYQGDDYFTIWDDGKGTGNAEYEIANIWGNWMAAARWNRVISPRLFVDNTFSYTHYRLKNSLTYNDISGFDTIDFRNSYLSSVQDFSLRSDWKYNFLKNWAIDFGAKASAVTFIPNKIFRSTQEQQQKHELINTISTALYFNNEINLFKCVDANIGLRMAGYHSGSFNDFLFEPRIMVNASLSKNHILNITYQNVNQYAHLLLTSGSIMNNEVWIPAGENIKPSGSVQYSLGWEGGFWNEGIQAEVNIYYKELNQLSTYKEGYSSLMGDGGWRTKIESGGTGIAKGIELLVRKTKGRVTGFAGYSFSKSTRKYLGINNGEGFLFDYDRPHSFSVNVNYEINEKWSLNASWVYQTGLPYTPVIGRQITPVISNVVTYAEEYIYGERNSARMKDYHRLDIGFTLNTKTRWGRRAIWNFSVYNVYNRHNPGFYYYGYSKDGFDRYDPENYKPLKQYQTSYFPIIPTISYKVFFEANPDRKRKKKKSFKQIIKNYLNYEYE